MPGKRSVHYRVSHAGYLNSRAVSKRAAPNPTCATGGFYKNPTTGQSVKSSDPLNIAWDPTCLNTTEVDIYLYAPGANKSRIYLWESVPFGAGTYNTTLKPKWWNSTASINLQLTIIEAGNAPFLSTLPAGPVFTATYTAPTDGSVPANADTSQPDSGITQVNNAVSTGKSLAPGKTAAAVIMPLLIVALLIGAYLKMSRAKGKEKRKRWSEAVDKRMSTISTDWKSMSAAGANAAIRNSIAVSGNTPGNRMSSFSFGAIRPVSSITADGGQAGIGAGTKAGLYTHENGSLDTTSTRQMSQLRPGVRTSAFGERVSRVSFAADPRPSGESRRTANGMSRAFHSAYIPPVPILQDSSNASDDGAGSGTVSPTQAQGPLTLTPEDIRARIAGQSHNENSGMDEVMPALSMMRTGGENPSPTNDDFLFTPSPPSPTHPKSPNLASQPLSPVGMMPMQPMPASVMSPDEMLRAYAERRPTTPASATTSFASAGGIAYPSPAAGMANYNGGGMRTLYSPASPVSATPMISAGPGAALGAERRMSKMELQQQQGRKSFAPTFESQYSVGEEEEGEEEGAYIGTAE